VDAVEYVISNGKIRHLAHEYSGRRQVRAIRNTHAPNDAISSCTLHFDDRSQVSAKIKPDGSFSLESSPAELKDEMQNWHLENHLLRQDEVARFVNLTKGDKYSALLPLLGLNNLEHTAENLRQLREGVTSGSQIQIVRNHLNRLTTEEHKTTPVAERVLAGFEALAKKYGIESRPSEIRVLGGLLAREIDRRMDSLQPDYDRYNAIAQILREDPNEKVASLISATRSAKEKTDALLDSQIAVLESTSVFGKALADLDREVSCPSCGRTIIARDLANHVVRELDYLKDPRKLRETVRTKRRELSRVLERTILKVKDPAVADWLKLESQKETAELFERLNSLTPVNEDAEWRELDVESLETTFARLVEILSREADTAPTHVKELIKDVDVVKKGLLTPGVLVLQGYAGRVEAISGALRKGEDLVRHEIMGRADSIIGEISAETQRAQPPGPPIDLPFISVINFCPDGIW
jgi:rubrerythrin